MNEFVNESFISQDVLDKFKGKKIEDIFEKCEIVSNDCGSFLKICHPYPEWEKIPDGEVLKPDELSFLKHIILHNLCLVPGIGEKTQNSLKRKEIYQINNLKGLKPGTNSEIERILKILSDEDYDEILNLEGIRDFDKLFLVKPSEILFLDIETTGLFSAELFLLGLGYYAEDSKDFRIELLFGRDISEEMAILKYYCTLLSKFKAVVTYNGKKFDIPFIEDRVAALFDKADFEDIKNLFSSKSFISSDSDIEWPGALIKAIHSSMIHVDLFFTLRKEYRGILPRFKLTSVEENLLNFYRKDDLPSSYVPKIYTDWLENKDELAGGIMKILEHNYYDVINMARILQNLLDYSINKEFDKFRLDLNANQNLSNFFNSISVDSNNNEEMIRILLRYFKYQRRIKPTRLDEFCL